MQRLPKSRTLEERIAAVMSNYWPDDNGCWNWRGATNQPGYPHAMSRQNGKNVLLRPTRIAYERAYGSIPPGLHICHKCDNRRCINPEHLFAGTQADNMRDMWAKGRHYSQKLPKPAPPPEPSTPPMLEGDKLRIWLEKRRA